MTRPGAAAVRKFNPGLFQSDEDVIAQFVVRRHELDVVLETVRDNLDSPSCQHVLVVAPRGRGKTMLLARAAAELRTTAALASRVLPVRFMEESHEILTLADFWLEALFHLAREASACDPELARELRDTHADLNSRWRERDLADLARAAVVEAAGLLDRKLVLMVENLQALCGAVNDDFGWGLRQALQMEPRIMLVGTATSRFAALDDPQEAFFELFRTISLDPLDTESCRRLWLAAGGGERSEREIRPLQILTGGNPRLLVIIAAFARSKSLRRLMDELVTLIDDHTEYFRSHLEGMAKTERRVYLAVIDLWRPSSVAEIAARARIDVRTVSAMLGRLVERGAIMAEGREGKRRYFAAERLYCIYYKMRRERDDVEIVRQFVYFMSVFYSEEEIRDIFPIWKEEAVQSPAIREGIGRAVAELPYIRNIVPDHSWWGLTEDVGGPENGENGSFERTVEEIKKSAGKKDFRKAIGVTQGLIGDTEAEIAAYDDVVARFGNSDAPELQKMVAGALFYKAIGLGLIGDTEAEIAAYDDVVARFGNSDAPELREAVAKSLVNKAIELGRAGDAEAEIVAYDDVVARFGNSEASELREQVAKALVNKAIELGRAGDAEAEIAAYDDVVARFGNSEASELREQVARALINKGAALGRAGGAEAEIAVYDDVVARFGSSEAPELRQQVTNALINKAIALGRAGGAEAEIAVYDDVIARFGSSDAPELRERVAKVLVNKGVARGRAGDAEAEIAAYGDVVARFGGSSEAPELREQVAKALFNRGVAQGRAGDAEAEIAAYGDIVARFGNSDAPELQEAVARALVNKGIEQGRIGEVETAIATFDSIIARFGGSEAPELQKAVASALIGKGITRGLAGDSDAEIAAYDDVIAQFRWADTLEPHAQVARAFIFKASTQFAVGEMDSALSTCDETDRWLASVASKGVPDGGWWTMAKGTAAGVRAAALAVHGHRQAAIEAFRSAYAVSRLDDELVMRMLTSAAMELSAGGETPRDVIDALLEDRSKAEILTPFLVALRRRAGETVRAPAEVLEVADDIDRIIDERKAARNIDG